MVVLSPRTSPYLTSLHFEINKQIYIYMCVCVCVCVCARARALQLCFCIKSTILTAVQLLVLLCALFIITTKQSNHYYRPRGFQEVEALRFRDSWHIKVVRLSALRTGRLHPLGNGLVTHFCYRLIRPQAHSATESFIANDILQCHHREPNPRPLGL